MKLPTKPKKKAKEITAKTKIGDLMQQNPEAAEALMDAGMSCAMCPMAQMETLEQGCMGHGMSKKQINDLLKKVNKK